MIERNLSSKENVTIISDLKDEKTINPSKKPLLLGYANSLFQSSGKICGPSNWTEAAQNGTVPAPGFSIKHWDQFEADLDLMAKTGANSYRFSIEWSHIEPEPGCYDELVLKQYEKMIAACKARNIEPMLTLFHFNQPLWFTQLGGFENENNIKYFLNFCVNIFNRFSSQVNLWNTINEPAIFAFSGYLLGQFPPHQHNLQRTLDVLTNLLQAHVEVYTVLKQCPNGKNAQIGLVHNLLKFLPRYAHEPIEVYATAFLTNITHQLVMDFLKTGHIQYTLPGAIKNFYHPNAVNSFDFMGLNFYANAVIGFNIVNGFGPTCFPGQVMSDMYLPIDPQGFAAAIDEFAALGKPVYVTEVGIADRADSLRTKFLREYLAVFQDKLRQGVDLRGLLYWTFADNYEWNEGYTKNFGLFDHGRKPRASIKIYEDFMAKNHTETGELEHKLKS